MAYSYQNATVEQLNDWELSGDMQRLFNESLEYIDAGNYTFPEGTSNDQKKDYFVARFLSAASGQMIGVGDHQYKAIACFDDEKLIGIHCGFYDPSDTSWSMCVALIGLNKSNTRSYIYEKNYTIGFNNHCKSLGATKLHIYCEQGSQVAFRFASMVSYGDLSDCYEEEIAESVIKDIHYYYERPAYQSIPTPDGLTSNEPAEVLMDFTTQSQRFTLTYK